MRKKRILAVLLSSAIAFSGMPGNVFAAEDVALEDGFSDGEEITEDVTEESVEDVRESVPEIDQGSEDFTGFSDGESEDFVAEEELEDETDPETQVFVDDEGVVETGKCGDDLTYTITGDETNGYTLTISGTGDMYDYNPTGTSGSSSNLVLNTTAPWSDWKEKVHKLVIQPGITSIGIYSFTCFSKLNGILEIPDGVKRIGAMAFNSCKGFSGDLIIPDSVEVIELGAFVNCTGFDGKVILSQNLKKIGESSFCNCYNLSEVVFGENVTEIGDYAFEECTRLTERMILPSKLKSIGKKAFYHCFRLNGALNIPNSVEEIGDNAFDGCTGIKAFYIPNSVKKMGRGCIPQYDDGVFSLIYGNSGSEAEKYAKDNRICFSSLDDEMAGTNIIKCGDNAIFRIKYDEIKNGIVWSVEGYGDMKQENPLNDGTYEQYADYLEISPEITSIGDYSLCQFEKVEDGIVFPGSLTSIGDHAFSNCSKFTGELIFPETLKSIGDYAFGDCSKFTGELIFPETLKNIGCMAFYYCEGLNGTVNIPGSVELIKEATFLECKNITSVVLHEGTTKIDNSAFSGCKSLQSIEIPMSVVKIKETAFDGCPNLTIHGYTGSYAEQFAKENLIPFKAIPKTDISSVSIQGVENQYYYTGSEIKPEVTVMFGDKRLELEKDYTVVYTNNTNLGTATVTITGTGLYEGNKNVDFAIVEKDHQWNEWQEIKAATYKEAGTQQRKCNICGKTENKEIAKLICTNHVWGSWTTVKEPSESAEGTKQRTCANCGVTENSSIPKLEISYSVLPSGITIDRGKYTTLIPDTSDPSWKGVIKYSTSNKKVATIDKSGKVKAISAGKAKITVKSASNKHVCVITVPGTTAIKGIKSSVSIKKGKRYTLKPKLSYTEKADKVTYKSSNKKIATVSKKGVIKGKKKGTATITIKSGKITKKCKVKVK